MGYSLKVWAVLFLAITSMAKAEKPNVLLITADDMSWDSLGCTGNPLPDISPNLDKLASEGFLIENCHIATPICGPSRTALYTGQYPQTSGYMGHGAQPPKWWKSSGRKASRKSITSDLHASGYITGLVGKHGTPWCKFSVPPLGANVDTGMGRNPEKYYSFVRDFLKRAKDENKPFYLAANAHDPHRYWARHPDETAKWIKANMGDTDWKPLENGKPYPDPKKQFNPADIPMPPSYPNDLRFKKRLVNYFDSVNRMDEVVGELLRALDESGLTENTIVIFLSDHGLAWEMSKWSLYPSGTKTPLIVRWPGKIAAGGRDESSVISVVDIAPTIAEVCDIPEMAQTDGSSFSCLLNGEPSKWQRTEAFACFNYMNNHSEFDETVPEYPADLYQQFDQYRPSRALSSADFTYVWNGWSDGSTEQPKTMGREVVALLKAHATNPQDKNYPEYSKRADHILNRVPEELYDTRNDPGCLNNLVKNPEYKSELQKMRTRMAKFLEASNDQELVNYRNRDSQNR